MSIIVNTRDRKLKFGQEEFPCRIGRAGVVPADKGREGDEKTPLGDYHLRFGFYRADRLPKPKSALVLHKLSEDDGWCDDVDDPAYNRFIRLPYPASHEKLWRDDGAYDVVLVMDHNDSPPEPGKGSAVFIHIAQPDDRETLGCVAVAPDAMIALLRFAKTGMAITISDVL